MNLDYRAKHEGKNRRTGWLPPEGSDARGFLNMALAILAFLALGIVLALVKSLGTNQ